MDFTVSSYCLFIEFNRDFLVRSGVLTSVHAFAVDPERGLYILMFLLVVIGGSLLLFATRAHVLQKKTQPSMISRESTLLLKQRISNCGYAYSFNGNALSFIN